MSVECMTSKSKSDLDSLEGLSVKLHLWHNLGALASVGVGRSWGTCFKRLQPGLQYAPIIPGKAGPLPEHWKSGFQLKGRTRFFSGPNRKVGLNHVKMCMDKVTFAVAVPHGSYNTCFNTVTHFVGNNIFILQKDSCSGALALFSIQLFMTKVSLYLKSLWTQCYNSSLVIEYLLPSVSRASAFFARRHALKRSFLVGQCLCWSDIQEEHIEVADGWHIS